MVMQRRSLGNIRQTIMEKKYINERIEESAKKEFLTKCRKEHQHNTKNKQA